MYPSSGVLIYGSCSTYEIGRVLITHPSHCLHLDMPSFAVNSTITGWALSMASNNNMRAPSAFRRTGSVVGRPI